MIKRLIFFVLANFCLSLTAGLLGNPEETVIQAQFLCNDRIRNVIAVDNSPERHFYVSTFGLDNFNSSATTPPQGKEAKLFRFRVNNGRPSWSIEDLAQISMKNTHIHYNNGDSWQVSAYNDDDILDINSEFSDIEAQQRIEGATGFWSSPVLYKDNSTIHNRIILLNKSGRLFSINADFTDRNAEVSWDLNLRDYERNDNNSFKNEYMSTPTLIEDKLFVLGIHKLFIVNAYNGSLLNQIQLIPAGDQDYFVSPITYDTSDELHRLLYAISKENKVFKINGSTASAFQINFSQPLTGLNNSLTSPLIDNSGYIYFAGSSEFSVGNNPRFDYISQNIRTVETESNSYYQVNSNLTSSGYKGTIIADQYNGLYFLNDSSIDFYYKNYTFDEFDGSTEFNPVDFNLLITQNTQTGYRYVNNHPALLERADLARTVIVSINNQSEQPDYYPTEVEDIGVDQLQISFFSVSVMDISSLEREALETDSLLRYQYYDESGLGNSSWGGVTSYLTYAGNLNVMYPNENGQIVTYNIHMPALLGVGPSAESNDPLASVDPPLGYSKFQKSIDNVINYEIQPVFIVNGISAVDSIAYIYVNGYCKVPEYEITEEGEHIYTSIFNNLLKGPSYSVTLITGNESIGYTPYQYMGTNIEDGEVTFNLDNVDLYVTGINEVHYVTENSYWDNIYLEGRNCTLVIEEGVTCIANNIEIGDEAKIQIMDDALLEVNLSVCKSINGEATIEIDEYGAKTGLLKVNQRMLLLDNTNILLRGPNLNIPSFDICFLKVNNNASIEFKSLNSEIMPNESAKISTIENSGEIVINDCVLIENSYNDNFFSENGSIFINNNQQGVIFGHLKIGGNNLFVSITIRSTFNIGYDGMTNPESAQLTIDNASVRFNGINYTYRDYTVFGTINVLDSGECKIYSDTQLHFKEGSKMNLKGVIGNSRKGAQLIAEDFGVIKFSPGVEITGRKPAPGSSSSYSFGDRIITMNNGDIRGTDFVNPRKLTGLQISSTHPDNLRWQGLSINKDYGVDEHFKLSNSQISGIDTLYVRYPGEEPIFSNVDFSNCKYGVYSTTSDEYSQDIEISNCSFEDCDYGVYLEDINPNSPIWSLTGLVNNCNFGNEDYISGFNRYGITLRGTENVSINACNFYRNGYGIFNIQSSVLVGGHYDDDDIIQSDSPNYFYNNEKAGIYFGQSANSESKSLVYQNAFSGDYSNSTANSGTGIWANESVVDIVDNVLSKLDGQGILVKSYSWNSEYEYHGFAENIFDNNKGCELIGDPASLSTSAQGHNRFIDFEFHDTGLLPKDPLVNFDSWDKYILASLVSTPTRPSDVRGNFFEQIPLYHQERFYPSYHYFTFDQRSMGPLEQIITTGMDQFYEGLFDESIQSMKHAVDVYPDSTLTKLAIDFLYLATRASTQDYATLRAYLDLKIPTETFATYIKKEEVKTKCYVKEEDYTTAISRLQLILDNPETVADSIFALIDQAYCYMNLAEAGSKALPNISVKTPDFVSYMDFLYDLSLFSEQNADNSHLISPVLNIESNYPNPFNPETTISYSIPKDGKVIVSVYNLKGQKVKQLLNDHLIAGRHKMVWDGKNSSGQKVSSGLYLVKIKHDNTHRLHKMMLMK